MAISLLVKINIVGLLESKPEIIKELQEIGTVHISPVSSRQEPSVSLPSDTQLQINCQQIAQLIEGLTRFGGKRNMFKDMLPAKFLLPEEKFQETISKFDYQQVWTEYQSLEKELHSINEKEHHLSIELKHLLNWRPLDIEFEILKATNITTCILGTIPYTAWQRLTEESEELKYCYLEVISESKFEKHIFLSYHKEIESNVTELLRGCNFVQFKPALTPLEKVPHKVNGGLKPPLVQTVSPVRGRTSLTGLTGKAPDIIENYKRRLSKIPEEKETILIKLNKLSKHLPQLFCMYDYYTSLSLQAEIQSQSLQTRAAFVMDGWIKEKDLPYLQKRMAQKSTAISPHQKFWCGDIVPVKPEPQETPPVALENKRLFKPFEVITNLYGLPAKTEFDPTPILAPFFFLFFGLCLTDAGYGLVLWFLAHIGLKKLKLGLGGKRLLQLLRIIGIATILVGLLTGSFFGINFSILGKGWNWAKTLIMIFNPMKQPMMFLILALGLGFFQIWFGFLLHMLENFRMKRYLDGILDQGTWLVLTLSLLLLGLTVAGILPEVWKSLTLITTCISILTVLLFQGRKSKNIFARLFQGIYGLYGIMGIFGDVLSYSRLLALGLATGVLAMVVNTMAALVVKIPLIGPLLMVTLLIGGHLFTIVINSLGSFIHCTRLQFVEFFTKFYQAGGEPFKPFKKDYKYTIIQ